MTELATVLICVVLPLVWMISGLLVAAVTQKWVKGDTAMKRLPLNILIILFWPVWITHLTGKV